jgi:hypothetical protein
MAQAVYLRHDDDVRVPIETGTDECSAEIIDLAASQIREAEDRLPALPDHAPVALIHRPARSAMTYGPRARHWRLDLQAERPLWLEPLMGWTAGDDPKRQISLTFTTKDAAVGFARLQGWYPLVLPENRRKAVVRSYADNFRADRRIRGSSLGDTG